MKELSSPIERLVGLMREVEIVGTIVIPIAFQDAKYYITKEVTFEVQTKQTAYNAIFGREMLSSFGVVIHHNYLVMKVPSIMRIISVRGNQQESRQIKAVRRVN